MDSKTFERQDLPTTPTIMMESSTHLHHSDSLHSSPWQIHIIGDAYMDLFCFLQDALPKPGGDARLVQPIQQFVGGSAVNTATHLQAYLKRAALEHHTAELSENGCCWNDQTIPSVCLHTAINETDAYGQAMRQHAQEQGFQLMNCYEPTNDKESSLATGHCVCIVTQGDRSFLTHQGCMGTFSAQDVNQLWFSPNVSSMMHVSSNSTPQQPHQPHQHPIPYTHIHIAGYYNMEGFHNGSLQQTLESILGQRQDQSMETTVSLVTQYDATETWDAGIREVFSWLDFLIVNELEATQLVQRHALSSSKDSTTTSTPLVEEIHVLQQQQSSSKEDGSDSTNNTSTEKWVDLWKRGFAEWNMNTTGSSSSSPSFSTVVVVTMGPQGAVALAEGRIVAQVSPAVTVERVVDPTGAGDAFAAGFVQGLWHWRRRKQIQKQQNGDREARLFADLSSSEGNDDETTKSTKRNSCQWPVEAILEGLHWGCAMGTSAVTIAGASVPASMESIHQLYNQQKQ